jgi:hypothetical protein
MHSRTDVRYTAEVSDTQDRPSADVLLLLVCWCANPATDMHTCQELGAGTTNSSSWGCESHAVNHSLQLGSRASTHAKKPLHGLPVVMNKQAA